MPKIQYAKTIAALSAAVPCDRKTFYRWRERAEAPGHVSGKGYQVIAWRRFIQENSKSAEKTKEATQLSKTKEAIAEIDRKTAERKWQILEREYLPVAEMVEAIQTVDSLIVREIRKAIEHELPPVLEGMKAIEIQRELKAALNKCFARLQEKLLKLK